VYGDSINKKSGRLGVVCAILSFLIIAEANAELVGVLPATPGGTDYQAYYDEVADLTWLADANAAGTTMSWYDASAWAAGLDINGVTGWRLPNTHPIDGTTADDANYSCDGIEDRGYNISAPGTLYAGSTASEMAYLYHNTLGNKSYYDPVLSAGSHCMGPQSGWGLTNTGPFSNIQSYYYWSATTTAYDAGFAWGFHFTIGGRQGTDGKYGNRWVWAVHSGNAGTLAADADINRDGFVNAADVLLATQAATGIRQLNPAEFWHADVAPLIPSVPAPNGEFDLADVLLITRKALGLICF